LNDGEVEPLVALMDEDVAWSGQRSGVRFWRPPPACHGPDEARAVLRSGIECYRPRAVGDWQLDDVAGDDTTVVVSYSWTGPNGARVQRAQLLTLQAGLIVAIRDYASPKRALHAARGLGAPATGGRPASSGRG